MKVHIFLCILLLLNGIACYYFATKKYPRTKSDDYLMLFTGIMGAILAAFILRGF